MAALVAGAHVAVAGEWSIVSSLAVSETITDNVDLDSEDQEESALVTAVTPGVSVRGTGKRLNLSLDALPTLRHQTSGDDKGVNLDTTLAGFGSLEAYQDRLFIDASSSISEQNLDTRNPDSPSNRDRVQTYRLSPSFRQRFGSFADAELRYTLDQVLVDSEEDPTSSNDASDSPTHGVSVSLDSGREFSRLRWSLGASGSESDRSDDDDVSRRDVNLDLEYAVARYLSLLGGGGYQQFDDGVPSNDIDGPTWQAGFRWQPGPRTVLRATYGERDDEESLDLSFGYDISSRTRLTASYNERLDTSQGRLSQGLTFIGTDPDTGQLIDTRTGLPFDPNASGLRIRDETTRTETLRIGIVGSRGRNTFSLSGTVEDEEIEPTGDGDDAITVTANWNRQLTRRLGMSITGNYEKIDFGQEAREDNEYEFGGELNYNVFRNVNAGLGYSFRKQDSQLAIDEFTANMVTITLSAIF